MSRSCFEAQFHIETKCNKMTSLLLLRTVFGGTLLWYWFFWLTGPTNRCDTGKARCDHFSQTLAPIESPNAYCGDYQSIPNTLSTWTMISTILMSFSGIGIFWMFPLEKMLPSTSRSHVVALLSSNTSRCKFFKISESVGKSEDTPPLTKLSILSKSVRSASKSNFAWLTLRIGTNLCIRGALQSSSEMVTWGTIQLHRLVAMYPLFRKCRNKRQKLQV